MNRGIVEKICENVKKVVKFLLVFAIIFTTLDLRSLVASAVENRTSGICDSVGVPGVKVSMTKIAGGVDTGQIMTSIISKSEELIADVQMNAQFDKGQSRGLSLKIELPYLYITPEGALVATTDITQVPESQRGENLMGVQARIIQTGDFDFPFGTDSTTKHKGTLQVTSEAALVPGQVQSVQLGFSFYGPVPENAAAAIKVGGGYKEYLPSSESSESCQINYVTAPGAGENSTYTIINSNLTWQPIIEQVGQPVMWDKYNYMTYKVTLKNTSTDPDSFFDAYDFNFKVPNVNDSSYGILDKDIMGWIYNPNGDPIKNDDMNIVDRQYIGIPNDGGVLIYDVTDANQDDLDKWDLDDYSNVTDTSIPYHYTVDRTINIATSDENDPVKAGEERVFYVAIPFANNLPNFLDYKISTEFYPTIYFAKGLSWSKTIKDTHRFIAPMPGFTHEKYVLDKNSNKTDRIETAIGDTVNYYLSGFKNTGNLPAFNPVVTDTLPENFDLQTIKIEMNFDPSEPTYTPDLSEWFKTDKILEFEFKDTDGNLSYVNLGNFTEEKRDANAITWSVNLTNKISDYITSNPNLEFTGKIRFAFAERIAKNKAFNGKIIVNGVVNKMQEYKNTLDTDYEMWLYIPESTTSPDAGYAITDKNVTQDNATVQTLPGQPAIITDGFNYNTANSKYTFSDPMGAAMNDPNSGFRYRLSNNSISSIIPAIFNSGNMLELVNGKYYGLVVNSVKISSGLVDVSEIDSIVVSDTSNKTVTIPGNTLTVDGDGNIVILKNQWSSLKNFNNILINFKSFDSDIIQNDDINIMIQGSPNLVGPIVPTGSFETQYNNPSADTKSTDEGTLNVEAIVPVITGKSYNSTGGVSGNNTPGSSTSRVTAVYDESNTGYEFEMSNKSNSPVGEMVASIDLSQNVGNKSHCATSFFDRLFSNEKANCLPTVKGFETTDIYISNNYAQLGDIQRIEFFDWDQNINSDTPKLSLNFADIEILSDGRLHIGKEKLEAAGIERTLQINIVFSDFYGQSDKVNTPKLNIKVNGHSDWFENLDATLTFTPTNPTMTDQIKSVNAGIFVKKPTLSVHTNIVYYQNTPETTETVNASVNTDGNRTRLGIPYDRNFKYRVSIENNEVSIIEKPSLTVTLPINDKNGSEAHTGFHTMNVIVNKNLLTQYTEYPDLTFYDRDSLDTEITYTYDQNTNTYISNEHASLAFNADGDLEVSQQQLTDMGVTNFGKMVISGGVVKLKDATTVDAWVDFYGYSDSNFGTENTVLAETKSYLGGVEEDMYLMKANDSSISTVSKMYFDTVLTAGFKDTETAVNGNRFDETNNSVEHIRKGWRYKGANYYFSEGVSFKDDSELDIGYKAIGSYMLDFRQYLNVGTNYPVDYQPLSGYSGYYSQEHKGMNYIYTQSFNTALNVDMTLKLPADKFDTYYVKVDPRAVSYLNSITVTRKDGTELIISKTEWQANINNGIEQDSNGNKYFRINLVNDNDDLYETIPNDETNDSYYKSPVDYTAENPVTQLVFNVDINQDESSDGINANNPDFSSWYDATNQATKYMFEVTGRFYELGKAEAVATTELTTSSDRSKERTDSATKNDRSSWSYNNTYIYKTGYYSSDYTTAEFDARHLKSTAWAFIRNDSNLVMKGVHNDPTRDNDLDVEYSKKDYFAVSFYRNSAATDHDYKAGNNGWTSQDLDDWKNQISFADEVILEDTLPKIRTDETNGYYGFLTEDILISSDLYKYIDRIELTKQKVIKDPNSSAVPDSTDGMKGYKTTVETSPFTTLTKADLGTVDSNGNYTILFKHKEKDPDAVSNGTNEIVFEANEYIYGYKIILKNIPGSADYARELLGNSSLLNADKHGTQQNVDIKVGGYVYLIKDINPVANAINTMKSTLKNDSSTTLIPQATDTGHLMGFRLPFKAGFKLEGLDTGDQYDYESIDDSTKNIKSNITPHSTIYGMKIWNQNNGTDPLKDRASRIKDVEVTNTLDARYNLKNINFPKEFVEGDWFNVASITLNYTSKSGNKKVVFDNDTSNANTLDLKTYLLKSSDPDEHYYFDVNQYIIEQVANMPQYTVDNSSEAYIKEHIDSFIVKMSAVNPDVDNNNTLLGAAEYLTIDKLDGYSFTYNGVWVNRSVTDVTNNNWTADSRPTFGLVPNTYVAETAITTASVKYTAADFNAENYQGNLTGTVKRKDYSVKNLVGKMDVAMERGKTMGGTNSFAYDRYLDTDGSTKLELPVDKDHIAPFDYIDYTLLVGADANALIPLQHTDMRFTAPTGQRIVGWKIESNTTTNIINDDISASVKKGSSDISVLAEHYYLKDDLDVDTNYKEINISIGDLTKTELENQIQKGETVKIIVYTQMIDELKDKDGNPAFEGAVVNAKYEVTSKPKHTYSQYAIKGNGNDNASNGNTYYSSNGDVLYYRKKTDFYRTNGAPYVGSNYTSVITSDVKFRDSNNLVLDYAYDDPSSQYDGQPMKLKITGKDSITATQVGVLNDLNHSAKELTYEVSFLSKNPDSSGTARYFKGFDLVTKPEFEYPTNMTSTTPIKVEYLFNENGVEKWVDQSLVTEKPVTRAINSGLNYITNDAIKIRWTYYDVPAYGTDGKEIAFATIADPFVFEGLGRYNNIRDKDSTQIVDKYQMVMTGTTERLHDHNELVDNTVDGVTTEITIQNDISHKADGVAQKQISRERPVLTYQTQIFETEAQAQVKYDPVNQAKQKNGYRPNDQMWYKLSVINNKLDNTTGASGYQGALLNPVFYDKIPEYVATNLSDIKVKWFDASGNEKANAPTLKIDSYNMSDIPDYGGDMVVNKPTSTEGAGGNATGRTFADLVPNSTNSTKIDYTVYQFSFEGETKLEVGESIEIYYSVTAREENLPMVYSNDKGNIYPEYYPIMGDYYQYGFSNSGGSYTKGWPLVDGARSGSLGDGTIRSVNNKDIMMDMNYLIHDAGISGTINPNIDRWEFLRDATTFIPGTSDNNSSTSYSPSIYGNNNTLMDLDSASKNIYQKVKYTPSISGADLTLMPSKIEYQGANNADRDLYRLVVKPRTDITNSNWDNKTDATRTPIVWSETRTHLQTGWLATSSELIPNTVPGESSADYNFHAKEYLGNGYTKYLGWSKSDPNYNYYINVDNGQTARHQLFPDDNITTLEYDESYIARLSAYNYGDWSFDGVEFIYVLPRGAEPEFNASGDVVINGATLTGGDSRNPIYGAIDSSKITVEVVQNPNTLNNGYLSPKKVQDPLLVQSRMNTTSDDYTKSQEYYDDSDAQSWVLKITVNQSLEKWFNRSTAKGYMLQVDLGCRIDDTNESEYWYDKVFAAPIENQNSLYYQIFDMTAWRGSTKEKVYKDGYGSLSTQFGGMDYLWDGYDNYNDIDYVTNYNSGSPNMPYLNGINIQNNEVLINTDVNGETVAGDNKAYYGSGKTETYASTGTRAHMRKPLMRTWTTMGDNLDGTGIDSYYVSPTGDNSTMNIHVENKYYWNDLSTNGNNPLTGNRDANGYQKHLHNYSIDGGNKGTLFFPVVTNILPAGVIPKDVNGELFTKDNALNSLKQLNWTLYNGTNNQAVSAEKALYRSVVEYIEIDKEDGTGKEGRYKITFYQDQATKGDVDAKIISGDTRVFSFDFFTNQEPDKLMSDGKVNKDLLAQYQTNNVYVTSQLSGFKFLTDQDIPGNPYYVGAPYSPYYASKYSTGDPRKDAIYRSVKQPGTTNTYNKGGYLPSDSVTILGTTYSVIDAVEDTGINRYSETDDFNLEDYTHIRTSLNLSASQKDFDLSGGLTHIDVAAEPEINDQGVHTSMRIRVKNPRIVAESYVSDKLNDLGMRDTKINSNNIDHYPTNNFDNANYDKTDDDHKQYGDTLWYTSIIKNQKTEPSTSGNIEHAKMIISVKLPSIVSYSDQYYLEFKDSLGQITKVSKADIDSGDITRTKGWKITQLDRVVDVDTDEETIIFEVITASPDNASTYQDYIDGKHLAGYFGIDSEIQFKIETIIDNLDTANTIPGLEDYWDKDYAASSYISFHETDGEYLNIPELTEQSLDYASFIREVNEQEADPNVTGSKDIDYDYDGQLDERHASDTSARVTVLKPDAGVRLDTGMKRNLISNPDAGIVVAEDPSIKGATLMTVYLDGAVNKGGAVPEFIVDYRVPFRGTTVGTIYEAPMSAKAMLSTVKEIRTGVWELPDAADYKGSAPLNELQDKLKVHVYALVDKQPQYLPYAIPGTPGEYTGTQWQDLGSYDLTENKVIDVEAISIATPIYQIRYVIKADGDVNETRKYPVPQGFRLDIDADSVAAGKQEMDEIDPKRENIKDLPQNVIDNGGYVKLTTNHLDGSNTKLHTNNFATVWARYDDEQFAATSLAARAGYFVSTELPYIQVDLKPYYYHRYQKDDGTYAFEWSDTDMVIKQGFSMMLKYKATIKNLTDAEIELAGFPDETQDNASRPEISVILPYVQDILDTKYGYIDASSSDFGNAYVNKDYTSTKRIERDQAQWTYYVGDENGDIKPNSHIKDVNFDTYAKSVDLSGVDRKVLTWRFDGSLEPGETINVEFMVPLATKDFGMTSSDLLKCSVHGYKQGSFKPYIPRTESSNETYGFEIDKRDINNNGLTTSEATLVKGVGGISFESKQAVNRLKFSYSEYDTVGMETKRPALVPEGTDYNFKSIVLNPDNFGTPGYTEAIIYDVLPHLGDKNIVNRLDNSDPSSPAANRDSMWSGWVKPETVKLLRMETPASGGTVTKELVDGTDCEIWVGPFEKVGNQINPKQLSDLPEFAKTSDTEFYKELYTDPAKRSQYFVRLSDIKALKTSDPARYEMLSKNIQAVWAQVKNDPNLGLDGGIKYELNYSLHSPLNLPQYDGAITPDMSDETVGQAVSQYSGWNTFAVQAKTGANPLSVVESPRAGVYLNAPVEKGYIGSYVWYDANYNADIDEGEYVRRPDGRLVFQNKTKDLDHDGTFDDPGINGVLVELLSANGYPVNKLGEAVVEEPGTGKFIKIDETTGLKMVDVNGTYEYSIYGPATYTTEADAYGNNGYFMISNVTPGQYKLRYTFPQKVYNNHALTTLNIGDTNAKMDIYRDGSTLPDLGNPGTGDVASDAMAVTDKLIVQTADSIQIDAIGKDPSTYAAYDEKMTSYNVGVARSYYYGGYAWIDELPVPGKPGEVTSNGLIDAGEQFLANVDITFYELTDAGEVLAKDADGKDAITKTDANGYFKMTLYPDRSYIAKVNTTNTNGVYKPSPITINTDPKIQDNDNDLTLSADKKTNQTFILKTGVEYDNLGKPIIDTNGNFYGKYEHIGLGFVEAGRGYIGKYVWDDKNYDGIRGSYTDDNGQVISEPGLPTIKFILERYYFDTATNVWTPVPEASTIYEQWSNSGGSYTFQNVKTTYTIGSDVYLAGYKISIDLATLPANYAITKFKANQGINDSNLPIGSTDGYLDVSTDDIDSTGTIIIAEEADENTQAAYKVTHEGKDYNVAEGKMILNLDLGLTSIDQATISGQVWDDKNYDGLNNQYESAPGVMSNEPGISNVPVTLEQYSYQNNVWVKNNSYVSPALTTDGDGNYEADGLESYLTINGTNYITGYKVKVDALPSGYAVTKYRVGSDNSINSDLIDNGYALTDANEYIIVAEKTANPNYDPAYIITNNLGNFDINKVTDSKNHDGGLTSYELADITGKIWEDKNYNGFMDQYENTSGVLEDEPGIENVKLSLKQYYLDEQSKWQEVPLAQWDPTNHVVQTKTDGTYSFEDMAPYVYVNAKRYMASYKVSVDKTSLADEEKYALTLYKVTATGSTRTSHIANNYVMHNANDYLILADEVPTGVENTPYIITLGGKRYDIVTAKDNPLNDGGFVQYQQSTLKGNVFEDEDYDGIFDTEESYTAIKNALTAGNPLVVTLNGYYKDENGQWQTRLDEHVNPYQKQVTVDDNGEYIFSNVDTQVYINGKHYLAGYKLSINLIPDGFGSTRYLMNDGASDSALYKDGNDLLITKTHPENGYQGSQFEELNGFVIPAYYNSKTDIGNANTVIDGYDVVRSRNLVEYNVGYTDKLGGKIKGTIFEDYDYNGFYDDTEKGINGIDVSLEQYYLDGNSWILHKQDYASTQSKTLDNKDGIFEFDNLPTHVTLVDGTTHLTSYRIKVGDIPVEYGVSYLNMRSDDSTDILDETRDNDLIAETHYLTSGDGKKVTDEHIIVAYPLKADDPRNEDYIYSYNNQDYDILASQTINDFDGGLVPFQLGSIEGDVWLDSSEDKETSYNGIKNDGEKGIADQELILSQYLLKNGKWEEVNIDYATAKTNADGHYLFNDLPVYFEDVDGTRYLYGYQLKVDTLLEEYAVTKYRQGDDSILDSDLNVKTGTLTANKEYIILAKDVTDDKNINKPYTIKVDNGLFAKATYYDILVGEKNKDYSAGYTEYQLGSIEGIAFIDDDYDGIFNNSDTLKNDINVQLKRYYYDTDTKLWVEDAGDTATIIDKEDSEVEKPNEDEPNEESFYREVMTDSKGHYIFDDLETYKKIDSKRYIYGYEVWIDGIPQNYAATKYQQSNGDNDSALMAKTKQLVKKDKTLPEINNGYITVAENISKESYQNAHYVLGQYDIIAAKDLINYNAGFTSIDLGSIAGIIWDDEDYDGIRHESEKAIADVEITLETYYYQKGKWQLLEDKPVVKAITSQEGKYEFNHLPTHGYVDNEMVLYGYKVKVETLPSGYNVTNYQANNQSMDSDLNAKTGYLVEKEDIMILAQKADNTIDSVYVLDGYNIIKPTNISDLDAGLAPYKQGTIEAIIFEDENKNGVFDEGEKRLSGQNVMLESMEESYNANYKISTDTGVAEDGAYGLYQNQVSDETGLVKFENVAMFNENNNDLHRYRLRMNKPEDASFTYVKTNTANDENKNGYGQRMGINNQYNENDGITFSIELAYRKNGDQTNYYGLSCEPTQLIANSTMYLGITYSKENVDTGDRNRILGTASLLALSGLALVLMSRKKKERE